MVPNGSVNEVARLSSSVKHLGSVAAGRYALYLFFEQSMVWVLLLRLLCYSALFLNRYFSSRGIFLSATILIYLLMGELHMIDSVTWHKIRGSQMVVAMKGISPAFDLDRGTMPAVPNPLEFTGYILLEGTVIFGPWVSYSSYKEAIESHKLVSHSWTWLQKFSVSWVKCQVCLVISNCITPYLFPYFILIHRRTINPILTPLLDKCFQNALKLGTFPSIIVTYTASALLHGLSFHLGAVLLSLGFITYVEHGKLRERLAAIFSACILSKQCPTNCRHQHQKELWVYGINMTFSAMAIFHLTYLGSLLDADIENLAAEEGYVANHTIQKWSELSWASHWLVFACWLFYRLIQ
ncbi:protein-serine O-palmitoleoyltransferase porcupine-like [Salvelinus fontinalis]|uniref:protein-serine O-palmitoleoyltransferase porcupine-like n=1 Tax=Salvelinus fontinalis TaxID=8038 RepID=UPI00248674CC|nr:protein-serine O-palmitoleoyltransferase porcupine-like [Salvelinus fontinalis]